MSLYRDDDILSPAPDGSTLLGTTYVAGVRYYDFADGDLPLEPGSMLELRREPDNPHDERAIEVYMLSAEKLGYVPRRYNRLPTRLMDAGHGLRARLEQLSMPSSRESAFERYNHPRLHIALFIDALD
jgi:hypothetical protein